MQNKIMVLGGGPNQYPFIKKAKENGLYVVLCDMSDNTISMNLVDKFYEVSIIDKEAVLLVAQEEKIDGIFTSSEPGMYAASYVSEKMNLPGITYDSFSILVNKYKMKEFLKNNNFNCPKHIVLNKGYDIDRVIKEISDWNSKIIIKPTESSGSRGVNILKNWDDADDLIKEAISYSRQDKIIIEEYIEQKYDFMIGGDIYIQDGEVRFWGLMDSMRDLEINDIVPTGTSFPTSISNDEQIEVRKTINRIIDLLDINTATFNVEIMFDKKSRLYVNELNARSGGNLIPEVLNIATGFDFYKFAPLGACDLIEFDGEYEYKEKYISTYVIHSDRKGILKDIVIDEKIKNNIVYKIIDKKIGEQVEIFNNASKKIGIVIMEFFSMKDMLDKLAKIKEYIYVKVE